jgi:O-antigen ligase
MLFLSCLAIFWSYSEGAWVALLVGALVATLLLGYKKIAIGLVVLSLLGAIVFAPLRQNLLFQNQSGQNRLTIWKYTWNYLSKDKTNFIFGAGTRQFFTKIQKPVNNFKKIEPLIYPHNIFLNFWSEIGLLGMLAFAGLYGLAVRTAWGIYKRDKFLGIALLVGLVVYLVHGLVDVPYFKNDLAFLWWIYLAAIII